MDKKLGYVFALSLLFTTVLAGLITSKSQEVKADVDVKRIIQVTNVYVLPNGTHTINGVEFLGDPTATMEKSWLKFSDGSIRVVDNLICPRCGERMLVSYYDELAPYRLVWHCNNCSEEIVTCLNSTST